MKALSLTQPWATLVAIGAKQIETRSWSTSYRGEIAIHASKGFPHDCKRLCLENPFLSALYPAGFVGAGSLPLGTVVALARLVIVYPTARVQVGSRLMATPDARLQMWGDELEISEREGHFGDYSPGRFAWVLSDLRQLSEPIACKGALGLWTVPSDIEERVRQACAAASGVAGTGRARHAAARKDGAA
jgi:hypothetical protein